MSQSLPRISEETSQGDEESHDRSRFEPAHEQHELLGSPHRMLHIPKRYILAVMAFFGFCNVYALRVNLSVGIVAMTTNHTVIIDGNKTLMTFPDFNWGGKLQGMILGSFFYGYIVTQLPGGFLANKFGGKYLFGGGIFLTGVFTLLTPLCARWSVYLLIAIRVFEGFFEGVTYPSIHAIWSKWAPPQERTKLATFAFSGSYVGTVISLPLSGALADSRAGWPAIFYVFGSIAVLWFLLWCFIVSESPAMHPTISNQELEYIQGNIGYTDEQTQNIKPPWCSILTSPAVWAIVAAHVAENWGFYTWLTELPTFMKHVLNFSLSQSGFLAALPYLVMAIVVMISGQIADSLRSKIKVSTERVRKMFTCGAFLCQLVFMIAAGFTRTAVACITSLTLAVGFGGFAWGGFSVNHLDIAPQYASILMGISNTFATIPGIISPGLTSLIVEDKSNPSQWQVVFFLAAGIYLVGAVIYGIFASGSRQKWAEVPTGYIPHRTELEHVH